MFKLFGRATKPGDIPDAESRIGLEQQLSYFARHSQKHMHPINKNIQINKLINCGKPG